MGPVVWVGGAPAAGKSTVARALTRRYGLRLYGADTRTWAHRDRALARGIPAARAFETLSPRERWQRSTAELVAMSLHRERGPMVLEDLTGLPDRPLVVAEGTTLPAAALTVDGSAGAADTVRRVEALLAAPLRAGPHDTDRPALLREQNAAAIEQVRGYHARPWAAGDPDAVEVEFVCECGHPGCERLVRLRMADYRSPCLAEH